MAEEKLRDCHDCGAKPGEEHREGCDTERCSVCGGQRIACGCIGHDSRFARWTGLWPGYAEAKLLGMDLNEFEAYKKTFFVKPKIGYHDVSEFYPEDPKPMKCPNCGGELVYNNVVGGGSGPDWHIAEVQQIDAISFYVSTLCHTIWKCPHCYCIVLRCEE